MRNGGFRREAVPVDSRLVRCRIARPRQAETEPGAAPLLLLHGLGCSGAVWERVMRCLKECECLRTVIAPDMPGYGRSPGPREALGMDALADWSLHLLDALNIPRAHVIGHSMGCQIALAMARRHPARVGGLTLLGPTVGDHTVPLWRYVIGLLCDGFHEPLRYNLLLLGMYAQMGLPRYFATVGKMMEDDALAHAPEVAAPALVLRGEHDSVISESVVHRLAAALPSGEAATVPGSAHAAQFHKPDAFTRLMLDFLTRAEMLKVGAMM